ncbi:FAD/NAD(P)-binding domain-containing protein [Acaromyces ingoldii]|uniref:FAD/NAD(P)-binding domain-containing protein n=1 Tax=Acaromyces ingoldii TaxID=215250 RepID=A0A316YUV3_9BASI|nr:FAD/NAD(P)-binding domain-containing protein [Acaromyces ingoldii]PWN92564.1 FAD/NAD(P)-binding domain-containing protein [Acaromyces ingoldii]
MVVQPFTSSRTVLVLGAAYAGYNAAQTLAASLPPTWRVVVVERNSHFHHLYAFPRVFVLPGHERKVFIPIMKVFAPIEARPHLRPISDANEVLHAKLVALEPSDTLGRGVAHVESMASGDRGKKSSVHFDYLVYTLGSLLPAPIDVWADGDGGSEAEAKQGFKEGGVAWMRRAQARIREARSVCVVGGGPLGVQLASDIAYIYGTPNTEPRRPDVAGDAPRKAVTLLASRRLLPRFEPWMHTESKRKLEELGVHIIADDRAVIDGGMKEETHPFQERTIKTAKGRTVAAQLLLVCTGQVPNTSFLSGLCGKDRAAAIDAKTRMACVNRHLQLAVPSAHPDGEPETDASLQHIFVAGDAADAFGALNAGHTAHGQALLAGRNIARLVARECDSLGAAEEEEGEQGQWARWRETRKELGEALERYEAPPHAIKVTLGLEDGIVEDGGTHKSLDDGKDDLSTLTLWDYFGISTDDLAL